MNLYLSRKLERRAVAAAAVVFRRAICNECIFMGGRMSEVQIREGESIEAALKRFRNACIKEGIRDEVKKRRYYRNPSTQRKEEKQARERKARRRRLRNEQKARARRYGRRR